jgi:hypothetical protein
MPRPKAPTHHIKSVVISPDELATVHTLLADLPGLALHAVLRAALRLGLERLSSADDASELVLARVPAKQSERCADIRKALGGRRINSTPSETLSY